MTLPGSAGPLPHHDGSALHAPRHVEPGADVRLRLRVPAVWGRPARVWLRSIHDGEPRYDPARNLGDVDGWAWWEAAMVVTNPVARYRFLIEVGPRYWTLNAQGLFSRDVSDYADFRLTTFRPAPEWLRRGTMYQIFPDRFARSTPSQPALERLPRTRRSRTGPCRAGGTPPRSRAPVRRPRTSTTAATSGASPSGWTTSRRSGPTSST